MPYDELDNLEADLEDEFSDEFDEFDEESDEESDLYDDSLDGESDTEADLEELEAMADEAVSDPDAADEFLGALAGLATKIIGPAVAGKLLGKIVPKILPGIIKVGRKLFRRGSRRAIRRLPRAVAIVAKRIARNPRPFVRRPSNVTACLHRCICRRPVYRSHRRRMVA